MFRAHMPDVHQRKKSVMAMLESVPLVFKAVVYAICIYGWARIYLFHKFLKVWLHKYFHFDIRLRIFNKLCLCAINFDKKEIFPPYLYHSKKPFIRKISHLII